MVTVVDGVIVKPLPEVLLPVQKVVPRLALNKVRGLLPDAPVVLFHVTTTLETVIASCGLVIVIDISVLLLVVLIGPARMFPQPETGVEVEVGVKVMVGVKVTVGVKVCVRVGVIVGVFVAVLLRRGVKVIGSLTGLVGVEVFVGPLGGDVRVAEGATVKVGAGVLVGGRGVGVLLGVNVGVGVLVSVGVGVQVGGSVGELMRTVLGDQFTRSRDGDRFYYENVFSGPALFDIQNTTLADIIRRNTTGVDVQDEVFRSASVLVYRAPAGAGAIDVTVRVRDVDPADVAEGCAGGELDRRLIEFSLRTLNDGPNDLAMGNPGCPNCTLNPGAACTNPLFVCGTAHGHAHFESFASNCSTSATTAFTSSSDALWLPSCSTGTNHSFEPANASTPASTWHSRPSFGLSLPS